MPNINDDGEINGTYLFFNHKQSQKGVWKITDDI
jgi:hypothetical protein